MQKLLELIKKLLGLSKSSDSSDSSSGFTLIELLIVIAVLGVLAASVLIAINPLEQFKRSRDAGRKQDISTIGRLIQTNFTTTQAYPSASTTWLSDLKNSGQIKVAPTGYNLTDRCSIAGATYNTAAIEDNICYKETHDETVFTTNPGTGDFIIYTRMESGVEQNKFAQDQSPCSGATNTYYIYQSTTGKSGTVCVTGAAGPLVNGTYTYK